MTYWYPGVQLAIKILKDFFPKTPITLGGIYATLCYEHAKENSGADYVWNGDYVKEKGSEVLPAYDLLEDKGMLPVFTSKGCPYKCSYCASRFLNPRFLQRDPVVVFEELTYYMREFGTQKFVFYDDALFYNSKRGIKKLLRIINASGIKFDFYTPNGLHARFVDEELAYMLRKAGFKDLRLSLETSDSRVQRITGNKVSNKDIKRAILLLKEAGFEKKDIGIYILVGAPWLNIEKTRDDIFFINSLGAKAVLVSYSPTPKTKDYEVLIESGIIESDMDPVWHNKAVFSERLMPGMVDEIKSLRRFTAKINETAV